MPQYFPWPYSVDPLPEDLRRGLWPVGIFALMSTVATLALLCWITYRLVSWRKHYRSYVGYNQYVLLIYNLLLADLQQSISFLISFHWIHTDSMLAPSPACFGQAWLVQIGDISSGMFVLAIALHTFFSVVKGRQIPFRAFLIGTIVIWALALLLTVLGPALHGSDYFTAAGAWCWASDKYETERLWLHYLWIFIIEFGTVIIYALIFIYLRKQLVSIASAHQHSTQNKVSQAARYMVLYPLTYVLLTLPLAAGRMATMTGQTLPIAYYCAAGSMMTSCGWVDAALYALTRRVLVSNEIDQPQGGAGKGASSSGGRTGYGGHGSSHTATGWDIASFSDRKGGMGADHSVTITGGLDARGSNFIDMDELSKGGVHHHATERVGRPKHKGSSTPSTQGLTRARSSSTSARESTPRGSTDSILAGLGGVRAETKVEIRVEPANGFMLPGEGSGSNGSSGMSTPNGRTVEVVGNSHAMRPRSGSPY
ncbi:putative integral membrane protein [Diplodia seriata]|uniref:Putative integral membrane protein n=1 Tax=Diplodia seriata TaxID=420778 RepID=A0A0G2F403_9PEZI|nr:putative integral membrane protein [Diplodia seriata]